MGIIFNRKKHNWKKFNWDNLSKKIGELNNDYIDVLNSGDLKKADLIKNQIKYLNDIRQDIDFQHGGWFKKMYGPGLTKEEQYKYMNLKNYNNDYRVIGKNESKLETYSKAAAIIGLAGGVIFLSPNLTGNAIADFSLKTTSFIGAGLLIASLIACFFWIKKGNKRKEQKVKKKVLNKKN